MTSSKILCRLAPALAVAVMASASALARDEAKASATTPIPIDSPAAWFPLSAYPAAARRAEQEGRVVFKLAIDTRGVVAGCKILASSGFEALDAGTCDLAHTNAHFKPALDARGMAIMGNWTGAVRWVLEKREPIPAASFSQVGRFDISSTGSQLSCVADAKGPVPLAATGDVCATFNPGALLNRIGWLRDQPARVTLQLALIMDGDPGFPEEHKVAGRTILMMARAHIVIASDGRVINCTILGTETVAGGASFGLCEAPLGPYVPVSGVDAVKPRSATILMSLAVEPLIL